MSKFEKTAELKAQEETLSDTSALKLPDDVAKEYEVGKGHVRVFYDTQLGLVDLNKISMNKADKLEKRGVLVKKSKVS